MATVVLKDIKKSFGSTKVIHGINISIADGEFIVIVGNRGVENQLYCAWLLVWRRLALVIY